MIYLLLTMIDVQRQVAEFNQARDWQKYHIPRLVAGKISIEAAELLECFEWDNMLSRFNPESAALELADVMICCLSLANALGIDAEQIIQRKLVINAAKYPVAPSAGSDD